MAIRPQKKRIRVSLQPSKSKEVHFCRTAWPSTAAFVRYDVSDLKGSASRVGAVSWHLEFASPVLTIAAGHDGLAKGAGSGRVVGSPGMVYDLG